MAYPFGMVILDDGICGVLKISCLTSTELEFVFGLILMTLYFHEKKRKRINCNYLRSLGELI